MGKQNSHCHSYITFSMMIFKFITVLISHVLNKLLFRKDKQKHLKTRIKNTDIFKRDTFTVMKIPVIQINMQYIKTHISQVTHSQCTAYNWLDLHKLKCKAEIITINKTTFSFKNYQNLYYDFQVRASTSLYLLQMCLHLK